MRKIICVLLCVLLIFSVCGCASEAKEPKSEKDTPTVILPDEATKKTLNGYKNNDTKTENEAKSPIISGQYLANKSTRKFHSSNCSYAKNIKESNLYITTDRSLLISEGYNPCSKCNP